MLAINTSIGVSTKEMDTIDTRKGTKTRAQHIRDNAIAYDPVEVESVHSIDKERDAKTSFYPVEDYIIRKKLEDSGIDFGKATKSSNYHNYLRCVAQMPARAYKRLDFDQHQAYQKLVDEGKMTMAEIAKLVEAME